MNQVAVSSNEETGSFVSKKFYTVKEFAKKNRDLGSWPGSESAIWALRAESSQNGFNDAFVSVGRRVLIDEAKFWEAISKLQEKRDAKRRE